MIYGKVIKMFKISDSGSQQPLTVNRIHETTVKTESIEQRKPWKPFEPCSNINFSMCHTHKYTNSIILILPHLLIKLRPQKAVGAWHNWPDRGHHPCLSLIHSPSASATFFESKFCNFHVA